MSNNDKAINYRRLLERILNYALGIDRGEYHPQGVLRNLLRNHPSYFRLQLGSRIGVLFHFFNQFAHDNPNNCTDDELEEHRLLLAEFAGRILASPFIEIDLEQPIIPDLQQENQIKENMSNNCNHMAVIKKNAYGSLERLVDEFKNWINNNPCETIGDIGNFGGGAHLHVIYEWETYKINRDTRLDGVKTFVQNYDNGNPITLKPTKKSFRLVNDINGTGIRYFYMYRV